MHTALPSCALFFASLFPTAPKVADGHFPDATAQVFHGIVTLVGIVIPMRLSSPQK